MINGDVSSVVLVEDETLFRQVLAKAISLNPRFDLIATAQNGDNGKKECERQPPDLLVTDVNMPGMSGIELAAFVLRNLPDTRVLALTHLKDSFTLNQLAELGVHGYVEKDQSLEILEEAMVEVASGRVYHTATLCRNQAALRADPNAFSKMLSLREQEILCLVAQGLTSKDIGGRLNLSPRSVATYRYRIMKRLELNSMAALIDFAFRNGFVRQ